MLKVSIILSWLFVAATCSVCAAAESPKCLEGYGYCWSVGQCVPSDYPCADKPAGKPRSSGCPKGFGYCQSMGQCRVPLSIGPVADACASCTSPSNFRRKSPAPAESRHRARVARRPVTS
jgi:hypothetical protein